MHLLVLGNFNINLLKFETSNYYLTFFSDPTVWHFESLNVQKIFLLPLLKTFSLIIPIQQRIVCGNHNSEKGWVEFYI